MNQKSKTNGSKFEKEMDFYVPVGAIIVELKDSSPTPTYDEAVSRIVARIIGGKFFNESDK